MFLTYSLTESWQNIDLRVVDFGKSENPPTLSLACSVFCGKETEHNPAGTKFSAASAF
jgi:hypothetical protein